MNLYDDLPTNTLLNDVFFYFFHHLPTFQNMHGYRLTKAMDLSKFVHTTFPALVGPPAVPETYMVSKELVAYLETLVAFTPYYRADDPRMSGKMETFYTKALKRYKAYPYKEFHKYISKKLIAFYDRFDPAEVKEEPAEPGSPKEGDVVEVGTLPDGVIVEPAYDMSGGSDQEAEDVESSAAAAAGPAPGRAGAGAAGPAAIASPEAVPAPAAIP